MSNADVQQFLVIFLTIGIGGMGIAIWQLAEILCGISSKEWAYVRGKITSSIVTRRRNNKGRITFYPKIEFEYKVDGVVYRSSRISWGVGRPIIATRKNAEQFIATHPVGKRAKVYYHPRFHRIGTLYPGVSFFWTVLILVLLGFLPAFIGLWFAAAILFN